MLSATYALLGRIWTLNLQRRIQLQHLDLTSRNLHLPSVMTTTNCICAREALQKGLELSSLASAVRQLQESNTLRVGRCATLMTPPTSIISLPWTHDFTFTHKTFFLGSDHYRHTLLASADHPARGFAKHVLSAYGNHRHRSNATMGRNSLTTTNYWLAVPVVDYLEPAYIML